MIQVRFASESDKTEWDGIISESPEGLIYHSNEWLRSVQQSNPTKFYPLHMLLEDRTGRSFAAFPMFLDKRFLINEVKSIPFCSVGGPCFLPDTFSEELVGDFLSFIDRIAKERGISNVKIYSSPFEDSPHAGSEYVSHGFTIERRFTEFILPLGSSPNETWKKLDKKLRNSIRKSVKSGVKIEFAEGEKELRQYYDLYTETGRRKGFSPKPLSFFESMWKNLYPEHLKLILATHDGNIISGTIVLTDKKIVHYWSNASRPEARSMNPNDLILWTTIEWAVENGYRLLDMGCSLPSQRGVYEFKKKWTSKRITLSRRFKTYPRGGFTPRAKTLVREFLRTLKESTQS